MNKKAMLRKVLLLTIFGVIIAGGTHIMQESMAKGKNQAPKEKVIETFTLNNGLTVYVVENHRVPLITHTIWYKVGAIDEEKGSTGLAHFLEHLMFKGTNLFPSNKYAEMIQQVGGSFNAFTSNDYTGYYAVLPSHYTELVMGLEADRLTGLSFTKEEMESERNVVKEERKMRTDNNPYGKFREKISPLIYGQHPYGNPIIGWEADIDSWTYDDVFAFYKKYYTPSNAIVVIGGDITLEKAKKWANKYYGDIPNTPVVREDKTAIALVKSTTTIVDDKRIEQPIAMFYYPAKGYGQLAKENQTELAYAFTMVAFLLGGSETSFLHQQLVDKEKKAISVQAYYNTYSLGPSPLTIQIIQTNNNIEATKLNVHNAIELFLKDGITDADIQRAKKMMLAEEIMKRDNVVDDAQNIGSMLAIGVPLPAVEDEAKQYVNLTRNDIMEAALLLFNDPTVIVAELKK